MSSLREPFFVEVEWSETMGTFSLRNHVRNGRDLSDKQRETIEAHYGALAKLLADPAEHAESMLFGHGRFASDSYADVRFRVLIHPQCPKRVIERLVEMPLYANGEAITSLHPKITSLSGSICIKDGYTVEASNLAEVGGSVIVYGTAKLDAPKLKKGRK